MVLKTIITDIINLSNIPLIDGNKLTSKHRLVYLYNHTKLGETSCKNGETVEESIHDRYKGSYSAIFSNPEFIVFITDGGLMMDVDIRQLLHKIYINGIIEFDAITPKSRRLIDNENTESLLGYRHDDHFDDLVRIIKEYLNIPIFFDTKPRITPRPYQPEILRAIKKKFKKHKTALCVGFTGIGKTLMALVTAGYYCRRGGVCLVTTPYVDTMAPYKQNTGTYNFTNRRTKLVYVDATNIEEYKDRLKTAKQDNIMYLVVVTPQSIFRGSKDDTEDEQHRLQKKYEWLPRFDMWIMDETHHYYGGKKTSKKINTISAKKFLHLTATPQNILENYEDNIVNRDLIWGIKNRKITNLPFSSIDIMTNFAMPQSMHGYYSEDEGFHAKKFFAYNAENNNFLMEADIINCINDMYFSVHPKDKNKLSISGDPELCNYSKNYGMMVLPEGIAGCGVAVYIPAMAVMLNNAFLDKDRLFISSEEIHDNRGDRSVEQYIDFVLKNRNKTKCVILTHQKLTTGTDIPKLGHIVLFAKISDPKSFLQLLGRSMRIVDKKDNIKLYSFSSNLELIFSKLSLYSSTNPEIALREFLSCMPLSVYTEHGLTKMDVAELLRHANDVMAKYTRSLLSLQSITSVLTQSDYAMWNNSGLTYTKTRHISKKSKLALASGGGKATTKAKNTKGATIIQDELAILLEAVCDELPHVSFVEQLKDLDELLDKRLFKDLIGEKHIALFKNIVDNNDALKGMINNKLNEFDNNNITNWLVYDNIFNNSKKKQSIGLVFTTLQLAREIIDGIPDINPKNIAVINALSGVLPLLLRIKYPNANITCFEYFPYYKDHLRRLGFTVKGVNTTKALTMKNFCLIAGNPPYQEIKNDGNRKDQNSNLWSVFTYNCWNGLAEDGIIAFITPNSWINESSDYKKINFFADIFKKHDVITLNINECKRHFDVGSSFSYFIVKKSDKSDGSLTEIIVPEETFYIDLDNVGWIPGKFITASAFTINQKTMFSSDRLETTQRLYVQKSPITKSMLKEEIKGGFVYPCCHTKASGILYSSHRHRHTDDNKVCISLSGAYSPNINDDLGYSNMNVTYILNGNETLDGASSVFNSKLYNFLLDNNKWAGFINIKMIKRLPYLDMSKVWRDDEIYKHFILTDDEITLIETGVTSAPETP